MGGVIDETATAKLDPSPEADGRRALPIDSSITFPDPAPEGARTLPVGSSIALDELGPIIVGEDGSLRRIANWFSLSKREQEVALRRLGARNKRRLADLASQQQPQQQQDPDSVSPPPKPQQPAEPVLLLQPAEAQSEL